jgi:hypothetical protein
VFRQAIARADEAVRRGRDPPVRCSAADARPTRVRKRQCLCAEVAPKGSRASPPVAPLPTLTLCAHSLLSQSRNAQLPRQREGLGPLRLHARRYTAAVGIAAAVGITDGGADECLHGQVPGRGCSLGGARLALPPPPPPPRAQPCHALAWRYAHRVCHACGLRRMRPSRWTASALTAPDLLRLAMPRRSRSFCAAALPARTRCASGAARDCPCVQMRAGGEWRRLCSSAA